MICCMEEVLHMHIGVSIRNTAKAATKKNIPIIFLNVTWHGKLTVLPYWLQSIFFQEIDLCEVELNQAEYFSLKSSL